MLLESIDCLVPSLGKKQRQMTPSWQQWRRIIKRVQKSFFFGKDSKKSFCQCLVGKIPKNIRVDVHEEKNDAESDIENIKSIGLSKNTG